MNKNHKVRCYINGIRQKDIYPNMTTFELVKYKIKRFFRICMWTLVATLIVVGLVEIGGYANPVYAVKEKEVVVDNLTAKINELKVELVSGIKQCESSGNENAGLITFDPHKTNKKVEEASIGTFQFKKATVIYYYKTLYGQTITGKEAVMIALDDDKASELASRVIFETGKGLDNWINCSRKVDAYQQLKVIKSLEN